MGVARPSSIGNSHQMVQDQIQSDLRRHPGIVAGVLWPTADDRPSARILRDLATDLESICDLFEHEDRVYSDSASAAAVFKDLRDVTELAVALTRKLEGLHVDTREILETFGGFPASAQKTGFRWFMIERPRTRKLDGISNQKFVTPERSPETLIQLISMLERLDGSSQRAEANFKEQFGFGKGRNRFKISQIAGRSPQKLIVYFASFLLIKYRPDGKFTASANGLLHAIAMALYEFLTGKEADAEGAPDLLRFMKQSIKYLRVARQQSVDDKTSHALDARTSTDQYWNSMIRDYYGHASAKITRLSIPARELLEKLRHEREQKDALTQPARRDEGPLLG